MITARAALPVALASRVSTANCGHFFFQC